MSREPDPMKSISIPTILFICLCLTCGCCTSQSFSVPPNAYGLPLLDIWNESVALSGIDERTADLSRLYIFIKDDGRVEELDLAFSGEKDGEIQRYRVDLNEEGALTLRSTGTLDPDMNSPRISPRPLLKEPEMIDCQEFIGDLPPGTCLLNIRLHHEGGGSFDDKDVCIMSLENGTLSPLKKVDQPTSYLTIAKMYRVDDEYSQEDPFEAILEGEYSTRAGPEGERTSIFAFTPDQLARAYVEYSSDPQDEMDGACIPQDPSARGIENRLIYKVRG